MAKATANQKEFSLVTMTPEWAAKLLETNTKNRRISKNTVEAMARDMSQGRWRLNGDAIRIDRDGNLLDGQHRLTACVAAGVPFETLLMTGLDQEDQLTIDRGRPRGVGDNLAMVYDIQGGRHVAATVRNLVIFALQDLGPLPTVAEYKAIIDAHPGVKESAHIALNSQPARPALLAAIHYIGGTFQKHRDRADAFVNVFKTGIPDYEGDAAHALREMLIRERNRGVRRADFKTYSLFANTWDKFCFRIPVKAARSKDDFAMKGWDIRALYTPIGDGNGDDKKEAA